MDSRLDPDVRHGTCLACGNKVEMIAHLSRPLIGATIFVFCGCRPNFALNVDGPNSLVTFVDYRRN